MTCDCPVLQDARNLMAAARRVLSCQGPDGMRDMAEALHWLDDAIKRVEARKGGET